MILGDVGVFVYNSVKPLVALQGGTYSSKTYSALQVLLIKALRDETRTLTSVVGVTLPHLKRGALRDFIDILIAEDLYGSKVTHNKTEVKFTVGRSEIEFFSADDDQKVRGGKRDRLFMNEANLFNFEKYRQLKMRTREQTIIDWNPTANFWFQKKVQGKEDVDFCISTYKNNPNVPQNVINDIESYKEDDPEFYKIYGLGLTGNLEGVIFTNVSYIKNMPDNFDIEGYGLDFGYSNSPTAMSRLGIVQDKLFGEELIYETGLTASDIVQRFKELNISKSLLIVADSADPASIETIRRAGYNIVPCKKGEGSINYGIGLLKDFKIMITEASTNFIIEAQSYLWKKDKDGNSTNEPIKRFEHFWDGVRYFVTKVTTKQKRVAKFVTKRQ